MQIILQDNNTWVLRFDLGEEAIGGLADFMQKQGIAACSFYGVGSASEVELGYFNQHLKDYRKKPFYDELEIVSFMGNGSLFENKAAIHAHGIFGRNDFSLIGGHVFKLITLVTCEIVLTKLQGTLEREKNEKFNLNLLKGKN
jgi:uncharacterized protein